MNPNSCAAKKNFLSERLGPIDELQVLIGVKAVGVIGGIPGQHRFCLLFLFQVNLVHCHSYSVMIGKTIMLRRDDQARPRQHFTNYIVVIKWDFCLPTIKPTQPWLLCV